MRVFYNLLFLLVLIPVSASEMEENRGETTFSIYTWKMHERVDYGADDLLEGSEVFPDLTLYYPYKGQMSSIDLYRGQQSSDYTYDGAAVLRLFTRSVLSDGSTQYIPYAETEWIAGSKKTLLFLYGLDEGRRVLPIDLSSEVFAQGEIFFINLTSEPLALKIGSSDPLSIDSFNKETFRIEGQKIVRMVNIAVNKGEDWDLVYRSRLVIKSSERYIGFFSNQGGNYKLITLRGV